MTKKITPKNLNEALVLVDDTIEGLENSIKYLKRFNYNKVCIGYSIKTLEKEKARLQEQLKIFENTDINMISKIVYDKEFKDLIEGCLYEDDNKRL